MRKTIRKRILIDRLQYRLLGASIVYFLTVCILFAAIFFAPLVADLQGEPEYSAVRENAATAFLYMDSRVGLSLFVLFALLALHSIVVSHRIAGPLYRFRTTFQAASKGDLSLVTTRKSDYLKREVASLNDMFKSLGAKITVMRQRCAEAEALLAGLRGEASKASEADIDKHAQDIQAKIKALRDCLQQFEVDSEDASADVEGAERDERELETLKTGSAS